MKEAVYDFEAKELRPLSKSDFTGRHIPWTYDRDIEENDCDKTLKTIFPMNEEYHYFLSMMYQLLHSRMNDLFAVFFIGDRANGKTTIINLIKLLLGDLCDSTNSRFLRKEKESSANAVRSDVLILRNTKKPLFQSQRTTLLKPPNLKNFLGTRKY